MALIAKPAFCKQHAKYDAPDTSCNDCNKALQQLFTTFIYLKYMESENGKIPLEQLLFYTIHAMVQKKTINQDIYMKNKQLARFQFEFDGCDYTRAFIETVDTKTTKVKFTLVQFYQRPPTFD